MRVASTLKKFKVGDFVLVLPLGWWGMSPEFEEIRNEWLKDNWELDERVQVGEVKGLDYNHADDEILLTIYVPKTKETNSYTLDRILPIKKL